ncbi:prepilin peptidase [Neorhizobium galegae]|uniref:prepilin peptidase n=1 Tax=Neorhizobium galegae TaxID=399 RepID=UPI000622167D|nr:prepilin peptidase [Neorhizobium galegae]CDZ56620.1 Flp pilus assembly protein, protease CpaA [Neorhizobium galegae bv. orientalis]KAB1122701.1 prepilin peptidase [Neorhizobium galegae]MCQ1570295.1 prepilin peptidase [Neorhizobium galegae]MCQ1807864.1 prepilin peptidase [Neorhizobium galegae]UIY31847.1 prepilin peptidase [Neorhizobium galegae]
MDLAYTLTNGPATALAVALALIAAMLDHRSGIIPNRLTYPFLCAGLLLSLAAMGISGLGLALAGLLAASAVFLFAFLAGSCGGGDVKLMAALGALLGLGPAVDVTLMALMVGGVMAVASMLSRINYGEALKIVGLFIMLAPAGMRAATRVLRPRERHTVRFGVAALGGLLWCLLAPGYTPLAFLG